MAAIPSPLAADSVGDALAAAIDPLAHPLTALIYDEGFAIGDVFRALVAKARRAGLRPGGVIEKPAPANAPGKRCDMLLEDLAGGETIAISESRGPLARGCRLDLDGLARACALALSGLERCDFVVLNKFGKAEGEGGGFRCVISDALALEIPVVIGVPRRNLAAWRDYAGDIAIELDLRAPSPG